jgi:hypothetical protein
MENQDIISSLIDLSSNLHLDTFVTLLQSKLFVQLNFNQDALNILNLVLSKCPQVINSIGIHFKKIISDQVIDLFDIPEIISDQVIDLFDIPEIILLVQDVLNTNVSEFNKIKVTRDQVIQMIKNIFIILIESNEIKTSPEIKQSCLILLDLSIKLLESKVNVQKVIKCRLFR